MGVAAFAGRGILDCMGVEGVAERWYACVHTLLSALDCERMWFKLEVSLPTCNDGQ